MWRVSSPGDVWRTLAVALPSPEKELAPSVKDDKREYKKSVCRQILKKSLFPSASSNMPSPSSLLMLCQPVSTSLLSIWLSEPLYMPELSSLTAATVIRLPA